MQVVHDNECFRVAARPATFVESDDLILENLAGRQFLFDAARGELQALAWIELAMLRTFFEPTQSCMWHSLAYYRGGSSRHFEWHTPSHAMERG